MEYLRVMTWKSNSYSVEGFLHLGASKTVYNLFKVLAILVSLTATVSGGLIIYDASKITPPSIGSVDQSITVGPPPKFNLSFALTIGYGGSVYAIQNINLTVAIYPNSDGSGDPLFSNTTFINLNPNSPPVTITYNFSKTNPPLITHLSFRAMAKGTIAWGSFAFMGFGLDVLYTIF
jgi:hypothetical protein